MKCKEHDCKMVKEKKPGWGSQETWVCPRCAETKVQLAVKNQTGQSEGKRESPRRGGW